ncbi:809_t:CDS:2 [Racocetra fulgida]|uniref:phenylalanine--tRNA ligase n=1 Tax=Racocetra fulgida TaxID=60492 RepID=A0A9N8YPQ2_9GLOM|nr:809_t:CDS:2 [Racocetra fulgida]
MNQKEKLLKQLIVKTNQKSRGFKLLIGGIGLGVLNFILDGLYNALRLLSYRGDLGETGKKIISFFQDTLHRTPEAGVAQLVEAPDLGSVEHLLLPTVNPKEIAEKLTYYGLETKIIQKENDVYFEIDVLPSRSDLLSWQGLIQEIGILLNCQVKPANFPIANEGQKKTYQETKKKSLIIAISQGFITQKKEGDIYQVQIPLSRSDIANSEDLLEELLRIYDYNKLIGSLPFGSPTAASNSKNEQAEKQKRILRAYLTNHGWQEIITYSLVSAAMKNDFLFQSSSEFYQLLKPKNEYHEFYRQTLIASHLKTLKYNLVRGNKDLFFFEISVVAGPFYQEELLVLSGVGKFFNQSLHKSVRTIDFYWLKGVLENIFELWQIGAEFSFNPIISSDHLYSPQSAEIFLGSKRVGFLGHIHPQISQKYQISEDVFVAQISLSQIFDYLSDFPPQIFYQPVANFPASRKDLSFIFPARIDYNEVIKEMKKTVGPNLQEVNVFDVYQNAELRNNKKKSVSFHLVFQSTSQTLQNKEIEKILRDITEKVAKIFNAKIRD